MQKPDFVKIILPAGKGDITPGVKRFFNRLKNTFLEVEFSQIRHRKAFRYKVSDAAAFTRYFLEGKANERAFVLTLTKFN